MHDLSPFVDRELVEHHGLNQVLADRIEILERIGSLSRQLDALTHRALTTISDLEAAEAAAPAPAAATKAKAAATKAKAARPKKGKTTRAPVPPLPARGQVKTELLTYLAGREDPVGTMAMAEALGYHRTAIDTAIKACNGEITKVVTGRGPKPSLYLLTANLPPDGWPHTGGNQGPTRSAPGSAADQAERAEADRRRAEEDAAHAERETERAAAVPPISPRVRRELAREPQPAGEHQDIEPENLPGKVLRVLTDNGGMRVRGIAEALSEDPAVVARVVSDHVKSGNIRKNNQDGTYYAVGQLATA